MTPLVASIISENASIAIIIAGLVLLAAAICILSYRKRRKEAAGTDE
jgi:LPXTG-motif cell wall-anchored protein